MSIDNGSLKDLIFILSGIYSTSLSSPGTYIRLGRINPRGDFISAEEGEPVISIDSKKGINIINQKDLEEIVGESGTIIPVVLFADRWDQDLYKVVLDGLSETSIVKISLDPKSTPSERLVSNMAQLEGISQFDGGLMIRANGLKPVVDIHIIISLLT
jgi:hypothetical protein